MKQKIREPFAIVENIDGDEDDAVEVAEFCFSTVCPQRLPGNRLSREAQQDTKVEEGVA